MSHFGFLLGCNCLFCFFLSIFLSLFLWAASPPEWSRIWKVLATGDDNHWNGKWVELLENGLCIDCSSEAEGIDKDQSSCWSNAHEMPRYGGALFFLIIEKRLKKGQECFSSQDVKIWMPSDVSERVRRKTFMYVFLLVVMLTLYQNECISSSGSVRVTGDGQLLNGVLGDGVSSV